MTLLTNSFDGGTAGTTITTANSGGVSGTPFDAFSATVGQTVAFDNSHSGAHGNLSCKLLTGTTQGQVYAAWSTAMGTQTQVWYRLYLYFTANPGSNQRVLEYLSGASAAFGVVVTTTGTLQVVNAAGTNVTTSTATIPLNQWFRIEGYALASTTVGQTELSLFTSQDSATPAETDTSPATQVLTASFDTYRFGNGAGAGIASLGPWWMDDIGLSNVSYLGPAAPLGVQLTNSFDGGITGTTITAANSGAPSGNAFDNVPIQATGTAAYDNTHAAHGSVSATFATGATTGTVLAEWTTSMGSQTTIWFRLYVFLAGTPTPAFRAFNARSGATHAASVLFTGTAIQLSAGAAFSGVATFTTHPPLNQWFRVEGFFTGDPAAGVVSASVYTSMDSATPTETRTVTGLNTVGVLTQYWFGQGNSVASSGPFWLDDVGISNTGFLGPVIPPAAAPAVSPPGMLSPAVFPFPPGPFPLPNDAPPATAPYIIGTNVAGATTLTVTPQTTTSPGDAIAVLIGNSGGVQPAVSCTDTQGNTYSRYLITSNANAGQFIAVNPVPLSPADTITITYTSSASHLAIAVGVPRAALGSSGWAVPDIVNSASSLTAVLNFNAIPPTLQSVGTTPELALCGVVYTSAGGPLNWPVPWVPMLTIANATLALTAAWLPVSTLKTKPQLLLFFPATGNRAGVAATFMLETRFAPAAISPPPVGPGLPPDGPAVFPYTPSAFPSDAPPVTPQPYLIGAGQQTAAGQTVTMAVQTPTSPGDTIVVIGTSSSLSQPGGVTDTEGNAYALAAFQAISNVRNGVFIASNPVPLTGSDTITYTFLGSAPLTKLVIALGFPAGVFPGAGAPFLAYDPATVAITSGAGSQLTIKASTTGAANQANLGTPPRALIAVAVSVPGNGPPQFSQGWTVIGNAVDNTGAASAITVAWQLQTARNPGNGATVVETLQGTAGNASLSLVGLMPETRFAPAGPLPDMPPGDLSPGAWQNLPLPRGGAVTNTRFLTAPAATTGAVTRQPANTPAVTVTTTGALARRAANLLTVAAVTTGAVVRAAARALTAATATTATVTRQAGRVMSRTAATTAALTRAAGKTAAATVATAGTSGPRAVTRTITVTVVTSGRLVVGYVLSRTFAAAVATTGAFSRGFRRVFSAAASLAGSLLSSKITPPAAVRVTVTISPAGLGTATATIAPAGPADATVTVIPAGQAAAVVSVSSPGGGQDTVFTAGPPLASVPVSGPLVLTAEPPLTYHSQR